MYTGRPPAADATHRPGFSDLTLLPGLAQARRAKPAVATFVTRPMRFAASGRIARGVARVMGHHMKNSHISHVFFVPFTLASSN